MRLLRTAVSKTAAFTVSGNGARTRVMATPVRKFTLMAVSPGPFTVTRPLSSTWATVSSAEPNLVQA